MTEEEMLAEAIAASLQESSATTPGKNYSAKSSSTILWLKEQLPQKQRVENVK